MLQKSPIFDYEEEGPIKLDFRLYSQIVYSFQLFILLRSQFNFEGWHFYCILHPFDNELESVKNENNGDSLNKGNMLDAAKPEHRQV